MTWKSHRILTATSVFAITHSYVFAFIAMCGSIFPDKIEYLFYTTETEWKKHHRTLSHWFVPYAVFCLSAYWFLYYHHLFMKNIAGIDFFITEKVSIWAIFIIILNFAFWYFIGALFHLAEDAFCGGLPVLSPNRRMKFIRLFYVRTTREFFISYGLSVIIIIYSTNSGKMLLYWLKHLMYGVIR